MIVIDAKNGEILVRDGKRLRPPSSPTLAATRARGEKEKPGQAYDGEALDKALREAFKGLKSQ